MRTVVVLPAPFGPSRARIAPSGTSMLTPRRAWVSPKDFSRSSAKIAGEEGTGILLATSQLTLADNGKIGGAGVQATYRSVSILANKCTPVKGKEPVKRRNYTLIT